MPRQPSCHPAPISAAALATEPPEQQPQHADEEDSHSQDDGNLYGLSPHQIIWHHVRPALLNDAHLQLAGDQERHRMVQGHAGTGVL